MDRQKTVGLCLEYSKRFLPALASQFWKTTNPLQQSTLIFLYIQVERSTESTGMQYNNMIKDVYGFVNIYYGTTSGNSKKLAYEFKEEAWAQGFLPIVCNLGEFSPEEFFTNKICVFFLSTYGQGGPTQDAEKFLGWLETLLSQRKPLQQMGFAVFGLGNSTFEYFCGMAKKTRRLLLDLGATELVEPYQSDAVVQQPLEGYTKWRSTVIPHLISKLNLKKTPMSHSYIRKLSKKYEAKVTQEDLDGWDDKNYQDQNLCFEARKFLTSEKARVLQIREIRAPSSGRSTLYVRLQTNSNTTPACNVEIYPENIIDQSLYSGSVTFSSSHQIPFPPIPVKSFMKIVNSSSKPTKSLVQEALYLCKKEQVCQKYRALLAESALWQNSDLTSSDIIKELDLGLQHQASLGINMPRIYTLAGWKPGQVQLIISLLTKDGKIGLTSEFIQSRPRQIRIRVLPSSFQLPVDPNTPLIMIANGSGISPFRSILQYYLSQDEPLVRPLEMYFGCQKLDEDFYFREEWEQAEKRGLIKLHIATSRKGDKQYVQKLFRNNLPQVKRHLFQNNATFFVCGSIAMERDINAVFITAFKETGHKSYTALTKVKELHANKRIVKQVYG